jgi:hypothetical protein
MIGTEKNDSRSVLARVLADCGRTARVDHLTPLRLDFALVHVAHRPRDENDIGPDFPKGRARLTSVT